MEETKMQNLILIVAVVILAPSFIWTQAQSSDEKEAVRQAVLDYVEGVYNVDPSRIERSVHPDLNKLGFWRQMDKQGYASGKMTFAGLVGVAKNWNKDGKLPANAPKEITIFDVQDQTASAKLVAQWGIDYFHLAKYDGKWKIINVLWQSPPPVKTPAGNNALSEKEFSLSELQKLRWIEGTWRGSEGGQNTFYERYHFTNDAVLEIESFGPDQTLTKIRGKGRVSISNGTILHRGDSAVWVATTVDDKSIHFAPKENASNSFSWEKESSDVWLARLKYSDPQGKPTEKLYRMERVK
jgi:Putative lumazine-binding